MKSKIEQKESIISKYTQKGIQFTYSLQTFTTRMRLINRYVAKIKPKKYQLITGEILTYRDGEILIHGISGIIEFKDILYDYMQKRQPEPLLQYLNFYGKLMKQLRLGIFAKLNRFETKDEYYRLTQVYRKDNNHLFDTPSRKELITHDGYVDMDESFFDLGDLTL